MILWKYWKKKVLQGEINIKYDESQDIVEVFDLDPGLKERVEKTKIFYEKIIEGNKNMFLNMKNIKLDELNGKTKRDKNDIVNNMMDNEYVEPNDYLVDNDFD